MQDQDEEGESPRGELVAHDSKFAQELLRLPPRVRLAIGAADEAIVMIDAAVMLCRVLTDEADTRTVSEKLDAVFDTFVDVGETYGESIAGYVTSLDQAGLEKLLRRYVRPGRLSFIRRVVGEGAFQRLHVAFSEDADFVAATCHRGVEACLPYLQAIGDVADMLSPEQVASILDFNPAGNMTLDMGLQVLDFLDETVQKVALPEHLVQLPRLREGRRAAAEDLLELTRNLRATISGQSRTMVAELSGALDRKLKGALHALEFSVDSVSQSANSLIEFIDRLLRQCFPEEEVLAWVGENYQETPDLTYVDQRTGRTRPTKRGQALCLLHGGLPVDSPSPLHLLVASSMHATRRRLERLKHDDEGTRAEQLLVEDCLRSIEAFVTLGLKVAWSALPDETLQDLQRRLDPPKAPAAGEVVQGEVAEDAG